MLSWLDIAGLGCLLFSGIASPLIVFRGYTFIRELRVMLGIIDDTTEE